MAQYLHSTSKILKFNPLEEDSVIKRLLLPLVLLFFIALSKNIVDDASIIINFKSVLLVAFGMLLSAFIPISLKTLKDIFKSLGAYFQQKHTINENLISDYLISSKQR